MMRPWRTLRKVGPNMSKTIENNLKVKAWRNLATSLKGRYQNAKNEKQNAEGAIESAVLYMGNAEEAQHIAQVVAEGVQQQAHARISGVVSRCLSSVFGDDAYEFRIDFERARGRTEAKLVFTRDGVDVNPIDSSGGGVVDVGAFALRLSCLMLARPAVRRCVILDEPFKFVSEGYRDAARQLLESLSEDLGVQFIMVTHIDELQCGKVVNIA